MAPCMFELAAKTSPGNSRCNPESMRRCAGDPRARQAVALNMEGSWSASESFTLHLGIMNDSAPARRWLILAVFIVCALGAGGLGAWATEASVRTWYPSLQKPAWTPPAWLFGPAWSALYILMGVAAWRAWQTRTAGTRAVLSVYFIQLAVNASWSFLFFGLRQPSWALADIFVLWALLVWTQAALARIDRVAALLWLPYLLWVTFAGVLNAAIVRLN